MAVDAAGNVHVIGSFQGSMQFGAGAGSLNSVGLFDVFFAKYNTSGSLLWAKRIGAAGVAGGYGIAVDAAGNVFIGGNFNGTVDFDPGPGAKNLTSAGSFDAFLAKYDDSGALLWAHAFGANLFEEARCLALDTSGNVFIAGIFNGTVDFDPGPANTALEAAGNSELYLAKYSSAGALLWARQLEGTGAERVLGMATGIGGQVYLTGHFEDSVDFDPGAGVQSLDALGDADLFFAQYDAGGALVWAKSVGGFFYEEARGIATDRFGNVYLTGRYGETVDFDPGPGIAELDNAGINDAFFAKYDADGAFLWANSIGGDGNDIGNSIAVDSFGQVCVTGQYMNTVDFDPGNDTSNLSAAGDIEVVFLVGADEAGDVFGEFVAGDIVDEEGDRAEAFAEAGLGDGDPYGFSKACANAYTLLLAREHPGLRINACTPGFIETDLTRAYAESSGKSPAAMGMKPPAEGARAPLFLLFGEPEGNGRYYGSDAQRSPLDRYRAPGSEPYTGAP